MAFTYAEKLHILFLHYEIDCGLCHKRIEYEPGKSVGDYVEFDDWVADGIDGKAHDIERGQPVHPHCHKLKSIEDTKRSAKIKRIRGETKTKRTGFKGYRNFKGQVVWKNQKGKEK